MLFIEELDRPFYALRDKRGFFDKELPVDSETLEVLWMIAEQEERAQLFLRTVYNGGDHPKIEVPAWLKSAAAELKLAKLDSAQASSKTLRLNSRPMASSSNTKPQG
jgi:hypothetical protein